MASGHQLRGLVHLRVAGDLAVIEVRGQRHEPLPGEAVGHVLDVVDQAPVLLDHEDARPGAPLWHGEIA